MFVAGMSFKFHHVFPHVSNLIFIPKWCSQMYKTFKKANERVLQSQNRSAKKSNKISKQSIGRQEKNILAKKQNGKSRKKSMRKIKIKKKSGKE